jgi:hypothetical protein
MIFFSDTGYIYSIRVKTKNKKREVKRMKELLGKVKNSKLVKRATGVFIATQGFVLNVFAAPNQDGYGMVENTIDMATTWVN